MPPVLDWSQAEPGDRVRQVVLFTPAFRENASFFHELPTMWFSSARIGVCNDGANLAGEREYLQKR
jgi:hypothetical protein